MTPDSFTNREFMLPVGDGHSLYVHDWGKVDATLPFIFLHGGPGGRSTNSNQQLFDPLSQRVIFFDQRGCGASQPYGSLKDNTTDKLIEDIELIASTLALNRFILVGSSWGSCLALAYALAHPPRVAAMFLRGLFTGSSEEIQWVDQGRFINFFPDVWEEYLATVPARYRGDPTSYHMKRALGPDNHAAKRSAYAYAQLTSALYKLDDRRDAFQYEDFDPLPTITEMYYLHHQCFLPDREILDRADQLTIPVWLIQGRYDMICPPITAFQLAGSLPNSKLIWTVGSHKSERESWNVMRNLMAMYQETE